MSANVRFRDWLDEEMQNPAFRDAMEELEPAYQVARLRMKRGLTQKELANLLGTRQSSISRLESGKSQPTVSFLRRIAKALKAQIAFKLVPEEEVEAVIEKEDTVAARSSESPIISEQGVILLGQTPRYSLFQMAPALTTIIAVQEEELQVFESRAEAQVHRVGRWAVSQDRTFLECFEWSDATPGATEAKRIYQ